jgi:hypothetical protein
MSLSHCGMDSCGAKVNLEALSLNTRLGIGIFGLCPELNFTTCSSELSFEIMPCAYFPALNPSG